MKYFTRISHVSKNKVTHCCIAVLKSLSITHLAGLSNFHIGNDVTQMFDTVYQVDLIRKTKQTYKLSNCLK